MKELEQDYTVEIDKADKDLWHSLMLQFEDASFYQTWSYGGIHWGEGKLSHLVLKKNGKVVGIAQARIFKIPGLSFGTAYINWGPMWRFKGERNDVSYLRNMLRGLHNEYAVRRGYLLRIRPKIIDNEDNKYIKYVFAEEGFSRKDDPLQTVILDLSLPLDKIRSNFSRRLKRSLKSAEKQRLDIIEGNDDEIYRVVLKVGTEMKKRKGYFGGDQHELIFVHKDLPESLKLKMLVCIYDGAPVAALGFSTIGTIGLPLVGGTGGRALKIDASPLLWWKMIEYYKDHGFYALDAGGVNKERNPGGYLFKAALLGKDFKEPDRFIGLFDVCEGYFESMFFRAVYNVTEAYRNMRRKRAKQSRMR